MRDRERESTLRIMEALSGVEEELLERCEEAGAGELPERCEEAGAEELPERCEEAGAEELPERCEEAGAEELPERCEEAGTKGRAGRKRRAQNGLRRYRRIAGYGSLCAACLCAVLIGAACWRGLWQGNGATAGQSGNGDDVLIAESMEMAEEDTGITEGVATDSDLQCEGNAEYETAADMSVFAEPDWIDIAKLSETASAAQSDRNDPPEMSETASAAQSDRNDPPELSETASAAQPDRNDPPELSEMAPEQLGGTSSSPPQREHAVTEDSKNTENGAEDRINSDGNVPDGCTDLSGTEDEKEMKMESAENAYHLNTSAEWETICTESGLNRYAPSRLPDSYSRLEAKRGENADGGNFLLLCWSDGEHALWLKFTETKLDPEAVYTWEPPVFDAGEEWQSRTLKPGEDGSIRFAVLYGDGVLAEYAGWLTEEEIAELFGQIGSSAE